jgi:hypothetical protein
VLVCVCMCVCVCVCLCVCDGGFAGCGDGVAPDGAAAD